MPTYWQVFHDDLVRT